MSGDRAAGAPGRVDEARKRLIARGAALLADALLELAQGNEAARGVVERLLATPADNLHRAGMTLASLQRFAHHGQGDDPAPSALWRPPCSLPSARGTVQKRTGWPTPCSNCSATTNTLRARG